MFKFITTCAMIAVASTRSAPKNTNKDSVPREDAVNPLTGDFLTGFESGIFLRDKPDQIKEYSCPKAEVKMEEFKKVRKMVPAMTQMITLMKDDDEEMKNMLASLNIFVDHLDELIGVFDPGYTGGDFCAGLTFGAAGSNLLFKMASMIISTHIEMVQAGKHVHQVKNK